MQQVIAHPGRVGTLRRAAFALCLAVLVSLTAGVAHAHAATFDPNLVISDEQFRDVNSMTEAQIQAFLDTQPGVLKTMVTADHNGQQKRASAIIYDACQTWNLNPKVMLALMQKEQSWLTRTSVTQRAMDRAIGAGCPNDVENRYPGFGNQIWNGARMLDGYGEGKSVSYVPIWVPGTVTSGGTYGDVTPRNIATFKLYTYNPSIGAQPPYDTVLTRSGDELQGNANFWRIYYKNFGDPLAAVAAKPAPKPKVTIGAAQPAAPQPKFFRKVQAKPKKVDVKPAVPISLPESTKPVWHTLHIGTPSGSVSEDTVDRWVGSGISEEQVQTLFQPGDE